jgi:ABC-type transport system involved in multi-copper enzyme maturation permease subunit
VNTTLLIAADSIRALLRQRLLLGLMLVALALIAIFSVVMIGQRKMATMVVVDESAANASTEEQAAVKSDAKARDPQAPAKARRDASSLSKEDQQKLAEQMDQMSSIFQAAFYQVASFGGSLVSLFIFSTAIASEIRKGTIRITLTKPVSRSQYVLGKYLGGIAVMAGYAFIASAAIILFAKLTQLELSPAMKFAPWLMFCRQLMLGSLAMLLSLFVHPFIGAVLAFFAGNGFYGKFNPLFYLLPSYGAFNLFGQVLQGTLVSAKNVLLLSVYALDFVILMLVFALWRFRTKELV